LAFATQGFSEQTNRAKRQLAAMGQTGHLAVVTRAETLGAAIGTRDTRS
jgi:hypothetical protein